LHQRELSVRRGKAFNVFGIRRGDDGGFKVERSRNDEGIDSVGGRQTGFGKEGASGLGDLARELSDADGAAVEELVDRCVESRAVTDFGQDRSGDTEQDAALMGDAGNGSSAKGESASYGGVSEGVESFRVED
jgi:hypothetical protein